jgi:transcriptional regulator with XRE-family HTH domain
MQKFSPAQVGQRIRMIRGRMTQTDFAKVLGVYKQNYISRYERGRVPSPDLLIKIADHGRVTLDWLLTGKGGSKKFSMGPKGKKGKKRR